MSLRRSCQLKMYFSEDAEIRYVNKRDHLIVTAEFQGKNKLSGVVKNSVIAKADLNENVIKILALVP